MNARIALVVGTSSGGSGRHVRSLGVELAARGHQVAVLGPAETERDIGFTRAGLRFAPVPIGAAPDLGDTGSVLRLRALLRNADIVHAHGVRAGALCALAGVGPLVVTVHNAPPAVTGVRTAIHPLLERIVARRADVCLGVSGDLVERLTAAGARDTRPAVVAAPYVGKPLNGREHTRADLAVLPERPLVLTIGRLVEQKGLDTLLAAAPAIADRVPDPVIALAGDGPLWGSLHDTAAEIDADVRMLGHRTDVADLLAAADVFCLTSRWEGPSLVIMEALRAGLPVVSTRVGGIPDHYAGTVLLVPPDDPEAFAAAVGRVLDDDHLRADLRTRSGEAAEALPTEEDAVQAALDVYAGVARW
ncbi:glycosyltransferase family 4 protein [Nocardiopsis salina]|uniref:glycosyltransferase family 4 protein n=1 Tax=Nocardiopsis salina TaxID=245836 RepID=UPI00035F33A7|nr:glycosyltransferase family 4 protein [Nocardiopsis salina]